MDGRRFRRRQLGVALQARSPAKSLSPTMGIPKRGGMDRARGSLKILSEVHRSFVTAWISQRMQDAGGALRKVSPGATDEEAL